MDADGQMDKVEIGKRDLLRRGEGVNDLDSPCLSVFLSGFNAWGIGFPMREPIGTVRWVWLTLIHENTSL